MTLTAPSSQGRTRQQSSPVGSTGTSISRWIEKASPYAAISPFLILFVLFNAYPLVYGAWLAFHSWDGISDPEFVGPQNFQRMFEDPTFWQATATTFIIFVGSVVPLLVLALLAAFIVSALRGVARAVVETFLMSPVVISIVAGALIFQALFNETYGLVNAALEAAGFEAVPWLSTPAGIKTVVILLVIWKNIGYFAVIFMAGLATVPKELIEAARLDGASSLTIVTNVVLPSMRPILIFCGLTASVGTFQTFAEPQVMVGSGGGAGSEGLTLMLYQFASSFQPGTLAGSPEFGYASAVGWVVFLILAVTSILGWLLTRRFGQKD